MAIPGPQSEQARRFAELMRSRPSHRNPHITLTKEFSMTEEQKQTASFAIGQIVRDAVQESPRPSPEDLKALAISTAEALTAAFAKLGELVPVKHVGQLELELFELMCDWARESETDTLVAQVRKTCVAELKEVLRRNGLFPGVHQKAPAA